MVSASVFFVEPQRGGVEPQHGVEGGEGRHGIPAHQQAPPRIETVFLDCFATHILAFEGESEEVWFEGDFSDYEEARKKRLGDVTPKRVKYRTLL